MSIRQLGGSDSMIFQNKTKELFQIFKNKGRQPVEDLAKLMKYKKDSSKQIAKNHHLSNE